MAPIVCLRSVEIPHENEQAFYDWIEHNRPLRRRMGCLMERVLKPSDGHGETLIITMWQSHEVFDAWIKSPQHDAVDASPGHALVRFHPIKRYDVAAGYQLQGGAGVSPA